MTLPNVPQAEGMSPEVRRYLNAINREIEAAVDSIGDITMPTKASEAEAVTGTNDEKFLTPLGGVASVKAHSPFNNFAYFEDQKAANTHGGAGSAGYVTRTLNTEVVNNITGCSLASDEVTLPAGDYIVEGSCPAFRVGVHKCRLYNVTAGAAIAYGTSAFGGSGVEYAVTRTDVTASFTLASESDIRLEHDIGSTTNTQDFGKASNLTGVEVYSTLKIWKLD